MRLKQFSKFPFDVLIELFEFTSLTLMHMRKGTVVAVETNLHSLDMKQLLCIQNSILKRKFVKFVKFQRICGIEFSFIEETQKSK